MKLYSRILIMNILLVLLDFSQIFALDELKKIDLVKHVYQVYGVYDIVALVEGESMDKVKETITWKLRKLNGVKSTLTMIVME